MKNNISIVELESYIENAMLDWKIPGGAVAVIDHGQVISSRGYGLRELGKNDLVDENTLFSIGSCTKAFTATLMGNLVDEGKVHWDDPIIKFLPDFKLYDPWITENVTIRDMLCHRTGLMRSIRIMNRDTYFNAEDYIRRMRFLRPIGNFRTRFGYSNPPYILAGKIAEIITGQKWKDLIQQRFFNPLGMASSSATYQDLQNKRSSNIASPHANLEGGFIPAELRVMDPVEPIPWLDLGENAAGSIISNAKDMSKWLQLFFCGGSNNGSQLLNEKTLLEMISPQMVIKQNESEMDPLYAIGLESNIMTYGLGWYVSDYRGYKMVFHPGQINGFVAAVAFLPQLQIGGIILMNTHQTMLHALLGYFIFDTLLGYKRDYSSDMKTLVGQWRSGAEMEISGMLASRPKNPQYSFPIDQLTGKYESDLFGEIEINLEKGNLVSQYGETHFYNADLELWDGLTFIVNYRNKTNAPEFLTFNLDEKGKVINLILKDVDTFRRK